MQISSSFNLVVVIVSCEGRANRQASVMKPTASLLIVTLLVLLCASSLDARSHKRRKSQRRIDLHENFEIYHPKGLTVWHPKVRGLVGFGVEVFLNQRSGSSKPSCDICLNTTDISYGKFIIHDDEAIIRAGDNLKYRFIFQMSNGTTFERKGEFFVSGNRMFLQQERCSSKPTSSPAEVDQSKTAMYEEDINLLETIVYDVFQHCNNVTEISKNLYLNSRPAAAVLEPKQLFENTQGVLQNMLPKINWKTVLVNAFYYNDGVGFEVLTLIDKLKILQLSKSFVQTTIIDLDELDQSTDEGSSTDEDYNEIMFHDVRVAN